MKSTSGFLCDRTLTHITAALNFAMRQNGFITRWISTHGVTVYQITAELCRAMRDVYGPAFAMKALLQAGFIGSLPAPPEKRFLITWTFPTHSATISQ